jgi:uncharacterized LabA/DUF88 family protein
MKSLVYVDNSNVWIEGRHLAAVKNGLALDIMDAQENRICDPSWAFDFGKLLEFAGGEKKDIKRAVLFGSRPPANDSLWAAAKHKGFEVVVYDRNIKNKEKKIDTDIVATMVDDSFTIVDKDTDEMVLVAGDKDYVPAIEKICKRGIRFTVCFWDHAAAELKACCGQFVNMDPFLSHFKK